MANCQIAAFHGWAFNAHFWDSWSNPLSEYGDFLTYDRGYFNNAQSLRVNGFSKPVVIITHSMGLHFIEESLFEQADMLIVASGFLYFHPYAAQYKRRSRLIVQEMINDMEINPKEVLEKFYNDCFAPAESPDFAFEALNHQLLLDDLELLQDSELDTQLLKKVDKVCILHGSKDHLVSYKKGRQIFNQLQQKAQYFEIKNAGHAMPVTHHRQCVEFIIPEIEQLIKEKS